MSSFFFSKLHPYNSCVSADPVLGHDQNRTKDPRMTPDSRVPTEKISTIRTMWWRWPGLTTKKERKEDRLNVFVFFQALEYQYELVEAIFHDDEQKPTLQVSNESLDALSLV
jgi:hypothetical protein